jgi:hypothetical protein
MTTTDRKGQKEMFQRSKATIVIDDELDELASDATKE